MPPRGRPAIFASPHRYPSQFQPAGEAVSRVPISRILYPLAGTAAISLGRPSPDASLRCDSFGRAAQPRRAHRAILLQVGFTRARVSAELRELLPHDFTLTGEAPAVCFCGTFLRVAPTGRYPAPCPVKPGLSSRPAARDCPAPGRQGVSIGDGRIPVPPSFEEVRGGTRPSSYRKGKSLTEGRCATAGRAGRV